MDIPQLIAQIIDGDIKTRLTALTTINEQFIVKRSINIHDIKNDMRLRLITAFKEAVNDANPKISMLGLILLQHIIETHWSYFAVAVNPTFDCLVNKLNDSKILTKEKVISVLISLISTIGLSTGVEKLLIHTSHKLYSIRESIIVILSKLFDIHGDDLVTIADLSKRLVSLLNDPQVSVRQLAFDTLQKFAPAIGETLMDELLSQNVKPAYTRMVKECLEKSVQKNPLYTSSSAKYTTQTGSDRKDNSIMSSKPPLEKAQSISGPVNRDMKSTTFAVPLKVNESQSVKESKLVQQEKQSETDIPIFMTVIFDSLPKLLPEQSNERDLNKHLDGIVSGLSNTEDWQLRITSLQKLQSLALQKFDTFLQAVRSLVELMITQLSDLRSAVCKEAFKTAAMIAIMNGQNFHILSEYLVPAIIKQVAVKIQVISVSADYSIRTIIASTTYGYTKLIAIFSEQCNGKNAILRKHSVEYLCLVCALWSHDALDRHFPLLQQIVRSSLKDADQQARKAARHMYWVMANRPAWSSAMNSLMLELDPSNQKHLQAEIKLDPPELLEYLGYLRRYENVAVSLALTMFETRSSDDFVSVLNSKISRPSTTIATQRPHSALRSQISRTASTSSSTRPASTSGSKRLGTKISVNGSSKGDFDSIRLSTQHSHMPILSSKESPKSKPSQDKMQSETNSVASYTSMGSRRSSLSSAVRVSQRLPLNESDMTADNQRSSIDDVPTLRKSSSVSLMAAPSSSSLETATSTKSTKTEPLRSSIQVREQSNMGGRAMRISRNDSEVRSSTQLQPPVMNATNTISRQKSENNFLQVVNDPIDRVAMNSVEMTSVESGVTSISGTSSSPTKDRQGSEQKGIQKMSNVNLLSPDSLRKLAQDDRWESRQKVFEIIYERLKQVENNSDQLTDALIDTIVDLSVKHIEDSHLKIATEAMQVLQHIIENSSFAARSISNLSAIISSLFFRLADRRPTIRDQANNLLNILRQVYDPIVIISALSPKMTEVPTRIRTAVLQFLGAIIPYCEAYFSQSTNTLSFLNRLAVLLGGFGPNKPSVTLTIAGRRLLELLYKAASKEVSQQLSFLPTQHQTTLRQLFDWPLDSDSSPSKISNTINTIQSSSIKSRLKVSQMSQEDVPEPKKTSTISESNAVNKSPLKIETKFDSIVSPSIKLFQLPNLDKSPQSKLFNKENNSSDMSKKSVSPSPSQRSNSASRSIRSSRAISPKSSGGYLNDSSNKSLSRNSTPKKSPQSFSTSPYHSPSSIFKISDDDILAAKDLASSGANGIVWLLKSLEPETLSSNKLQAIQVLKKLVKEETSTEFWQQYSVQIASVLLESFHSKRPSFVSDQIDASSLDRSYLREDKRHLTGLSPTGSGDNKSDQSSLKEAEDMHLACKALTLLVKYRGMHVKNFMELLVTRLCKAASFAPVTVTLNCEQILCELAPLDPVKFIDLVLPHASVHVRQSSEEDQSKSMYPVFNSSQTQTEIVSNAHERLLALHSMAVAIRHTTSSQILEKLENIIATVIPSLSSVLADLRKSVIMVLVEIYFIIGDALYPHVQELAPPHRKLLTIYVEKAIEERQGLF